MRVACPKCNTAYNVDDAKIPPTGANLKCAKCKNTFPVKREPAQAGGAVPLPGTGAPASSAAVPLPGSGAPSLGAAIPMPGGAPPPMSAAIPMPGGAAPMGAAIPMPGGAPPPMGAAIPMPGGAPAAGGAVPLPGSDDLSFLSAPPPAAPPAPVEDPFAFGPPSDAGAAAPPAPAPDGGIGFGEMDFGAPAQPPPAADPFADASGGLGDDPFGGAAAPPAPAPSAPQPVDFGDIDFGGPPPAPAPAAAPGFGEMDFGAPAQPPPPAAPPPAAAASSGFGELDFGLPPEAPPPAPAPAAPAAPPSGGELDFLSFDPGAPAQPSSAPAPSKGDSFEFDPLSSPPPSGGDDLEADLSAPLPGAGAAQAPSSAPAADNDLELLDFIDEAGAGASKDAGKRLRSSSLRYQIRRKSGKVFGPFEQAAVVKMLQEGQLLGNEDVTSDNENWVPIGSVQAFAEAIQKLMESPGGLPGLAAQNAETTEADSKASAEQALERMKALYGDRMASIAIVDSAAAEQKFKKRLPLIIAAAAVLLVVGVGLYLGTTPYGFFGMRKLFPSHLKQGSAAWTKFEEARKALREDTFDSYKRALSDAKDLLQQKESAIESRALFAQSVFYLKRRFYTADDELPRAKRYLDELELAVKDDPEVVKARAGYHLLKGDEAAIRPALEAAASKAKDDPEFLFLLAETYLRERTTGPATDALKRVIAADPKSAKALHGLGQLKTLEKTPDFKAAVESYEKALEANPSHLTSAVEVAAIYLQKLEEPESAAAPLRKALSDDAKKLLAPSDQARAHYLMGMLHASRHQKDEAVKEFEEALKIHPESAPARAAYGRYLLRRHDYSRAYDLFDAAYKSDTKEIEYLDGLVRAMLGGSKLGPAAKLVAEAGGTFPGNPRIAFLAGRIADDAEKGDEAERSYKRAAAADAKLWEPSQFLGSFYLRRKRFEDAKAAFTEAVTRAPGVPDVHVGMGNYLFLTDKPAEAKAEYLAALKIDPESAGAHFGLAQVLVVEGAAEDARREFETAINLDSTLAQLYTQYGTLLWNTKDLQNAAKALEKAKNADPKDAPASWRLGAVYFELGNQGEAMRNVEGALSIDPYSPDAYFYKARIHYDRHENNQAIESIKSALERNSTRPEFHFWRGNIVYQAGNFGEAADAWQQAIKLKPDYADALEALGRGYQEQAGADVSQAIVYYERAMKVDPSRARLVLNVANCLFSLNKYDQAIAKYKEALEVAPDDSVSAYDKIGRAYNEKGKLDPAIEWWLRATEKDPEAKDVWRMLGYAYKEKGRNAEAVKAFKKYVEVATEAQDVGDIQLEINDLEKG